MATLRDIENRVNAFLKTTSEQEAWIGDGERALLEALKGAPFFETDPFMVTDTDGTEIWIKFGLFEDTGGLVVSVGGQMNFKNWRRIPYGRLDQVVIASQQILDAVSAKLTELGI